MQIIENFRYLGHLHFNNSCSYKFRKSWKSESSYQRNIAQSVFYSMENFDRRESLYKKLSQLGNHSLKAFHLAFTFHFIYVNI